SAAWRSSPPKAHSSQRTEYTSASLSQLSQRSAIAHLLSEGGAGALGGLVHQGLGAPDEIDHLREVLPQPFDLRVLARELGAGCVAFLSELVRPWALVGDGPAKACVLFGQVLGPGHQLVNQPAGLPRDERAGVEELAAPCLLIHAEASPEVLAILAVEPRSLSALGKLLAEALSPGLVDLGLLPRLNPPRLLVREEVGEPLPLGVLPNRRVLLGEGEHVIGVVEFAGEAFHLRQELVPDAHQVAVAGRALAAEQLPN